MKRILCAGLAAAVLLLAAGCSSSAKETNPSAAQTTTGTSGKATAQTDAAGETTVGSTDGASTTTSVPLPAFSEKSKSSSRPVTTTTSKPTTTKPPPASATNPPPAPTTEKSPYQRPFDEKGITEDLTAYGKKLNELFGTNNLEYITHYPQEWGGEKLNKENVSWDPPFETVLYKNTDNLKRQMYERLQDLSSRGFCNFGLFFELTKNKNEFMIYIFQC